MKTLLVMSDERQKHILPLLAAQHCEVQLASSCRQARDLLRRERFDAVLTDMSLPDGNWLTISRESNHVDAPPALVVCLPRQAERVSSILSAGHVRVLMPPWEGKSIRAVLAGEESTGAFTPEPHHAPLPV